jgi:integrase
MAQQPAFRNVMPLESVIKLHNSIPGENPIGMRDRAIISILISTGIRHKALVSLPLSCVDLTNNIIHQDPARGVDTKYKKYIKSVICAVDGIFQESLTKWEQYLRSHGFGAADPFIPKAKKTYDTVSNCFELSKDVEPEYWRSHRSLSDVLRKRCKQAGLPYFPPHNFRHLLVKLVKELDLTSKQTKCFSQSLGHEHEDTTYGCYGKFSEDVVLSTVAGINFKNSNQNIDIDEEIYKEFQAFQNWKKLKKQIKKEDKRGK